MADKDTRAAKAARRRAAFHAERARKAATPVQRFTAAESALLSAMKHARSPARAARSVAADVAEHARQVMSQATLSEASRALYEAKLAEARAGRQRPGTALMCLRGAITRVADATERDRLYEHYAAELTREAREIEAGR